MTAPLHCLRGEGPSVRAHQSTAQHCRHLSIARCLRQSMVLSCLRPTRSMVRIYRRAPSCLWRHRSPQRQAACPHLRQLPGRIPQTNRGAAEQPRTNPLSAVRPPALLLRRRGRPLAIPHSPQTHTKLRVCRVRTVLGSVLGSNPPLLPTGWRGRTTLLTAPTARVARQPPTSVGSCSSRREVHCSRRNHSQCSRQRGRRRNGHRRPASHKRVSTGWSRGHVGFGGGDREFDGFFIWGNANGRSPQM